MSKIDFPTNVEFILQFLSPSPCEKRAFSKINNVRIFSKKVSELKIEQPYEAKVRV